MVRKLTFALLAGTALSFAGAAQAADVYVPPPAEPAYVPEPAAFSWSGLYFGGHVGYARARATDPWPSCSWLNDIRGENGDPNYIFPGADICEATSLLDYYFELDGDFVGLYDSGEGGNKSSFVWGGQVGINQQYGQFVVGLEADISSVHDIQHWNFDTFNYFEWDDPSGYDGSYWVQSETKLDWVATFRGRAGVALGHEGRFMPYVTGGAAIARVSTEMWSGYGDYYDAVGYCNPSGGGGSLGSCGFIGDLPEKTFYQFGYAVGAGFEWAFTNHVTVGLEYLFVGLPWGKQTNTATFYGDDGRSFDVNHTVGFDDLQMIKLKVNLKL
jgi:outer membrane immunogenic protein